MATIRFHLDESVPVAVAIALRQREIDVTAPEDVGLTGSPDREHLEFCRTAQRVLVVQDSDFLAFHQAGERHCGLVFSHQQSRSIGDIVKSLALIWELCNDSEFENRLEYI
jgi:predicted nuclease of predicted toxin-antitoxin system